MASSPESSVQFYANFARDNETSVIASRIRSLIEEISKPQVSRAICQHAVREITRLLLTSAGSTIETEGTLLVPVLRAGLPMWVEAQQILGFPESVFVAAAKLKGTTQVKLYWLNQPRIDNRDVLILDTIVAHGDTMKAVLQDLNSGIYGIPKSISIAVCYASPEAIEQIPLAYELSRLIVGAVATDVGSDGYLCPLTHGDMGDKLFSIP